MFDLIPYLVESDLLSSSEVVALATLPGGVSCITTLVTRPHAPDLVVKQARSKLAVQEDWFSDPARILVEAKAMCALARLTPSGAIPALLHVDPDLHLIVMEAVPQPHENWKSMLLQGQISMNHVRQFGELLAGIHLRSSGDDALAASFADRSYFKTLRLDPYYRFTADRVPAAKPFLRGLIRQTLQLAEGLVHGDYSPKNVLVFEGQIRLLDHEVAHWGDCQFDVGFAMAHFVGKALHLPSHRQKMIRAARLFWQSYADNSQLSAAKEHRSVQHSVACILARVRGKSPLEYLHDAERNRLVILATDLMRSLPVGMGELLDRVEKQLV